jgi:hypothetical protein
MIHKQLVTDEEGRPVGVLIPYDEWLRIEQQLNSMGSLLEFALDDSVGCFVSFIHSAEGAWVVPYCAH